MYDQYFAGQTVLGHYAVAQRSGELAATIGALGHLARIRWTDTGSFCVLKRIRCGITISGAVTAAVETNLRAIVVRGFSTDFTTAITKIDLGTITKTNQMRGDFMKPSRMGASGPGIGTTTVMSGQTLTADAAPFAMCTFVNPSSTLGAAAVTNQVGAGTRMETLYEQTADGQHPVLLGANEGVVIQPVTAGPGTGTWALYVEWTWAEVVAF